MTVNPKAVSLRLDCIGGQSCSGQLTLRTGKRKVAAGSYAISSGRKRVTLPLSKSGRAIVANRYRKEKRSFRVRLTIADAGRPAPVELRRRLHLSRGAAPGGRTG